MSHGVIVSLKSNHLYYQNDSMTSKVDDSPGETEYIKNSGI